MNLTKLSFILLLSCSSFALRAMENHQITSNDLTVSILSSISLTPEQHTKLVDEVVKRKDQKSLQDILTNRSEKANKIYQKSHFKAHLQDVLKNRSAKAKALYQESINELPDAITEDPSFKAFIIKLYEEYRIQYLTECANKRSENINAQNTREKETQLAENAAKKESSGWWPWSK